MLHVSGYGERRAGERPAGLRHARPRHERLRPRHGAARRAADAAPFFLADGIAAQSATYAVMMALYHRDVHGGGGQLVDVNLIEPLARLVETSTLAYSQLGVVPGRVGNRLDASAPRNAYAHGGRQVGGHLERVAEHRGAPLPAVDRPDLAEDADYVDPVRRQAHGDEIDEIVARLDPGADARTT